MSNHKRQTLEYRSAAPGRIGVVSRGGTQDTASPGGQDTGPGLVSLCPHAASLSSHVTLCPQSQPEKTEIKLTKNAEN